MPVDVELHGLFLSAEGLLDSLVQLLLADDELARIRVQIVQTGPAHDLLACEAALVGIPALGGELDARGAGQVVGQEVADALGDGGLGEDVDGARGRHGEAAALGVGALDVLGVGLVGLDLALVQLLHTLAEGLLAGLGEALLVEAVLGVLAPGTGLGDLLRIAGALGDELV